MPLSCLIIDDEHHCRENLSHLIAEYCPELEVVAKAASVAEAKRIYSELLPDVLFLDIRMPGGDGFELLEHLDTDKSSVVFTTAHHEYAIRALKEGAFDYLEKPIDIVELEDCAKRLAKRGTGSSSKQDWKTLLTLSNLKELDKTQIPTSDGFIIVKSSEIVRLEASESYTKLLMKDGQRHLSSKNIRVFEDTLNADMFMRVHKSHIINILYHLDGFTRKDGNTALMSNGDRVPVSRRRLPEFLAKVKA